MLLITSPSLSLLALAFSMSFPSSFSSFLLPFVFIYFKMGVYPFTFHMIIDIVEFLCTILHLAFNLTCFMFFLLLGEAKSYSIFAVYSLLSSFTLLVVIQEGTGRIPDLLQCKYKLFLPFFVHGFHLVKYVILNPIGSEMILSLFPA